MFGWFRRFRIQKHEIDVIDIDGTPAADLMVGEGQGKFPQWREGRMVRPKWDDASG